MSAINIFGFDRSELQELAVSAGQPKFRGDQIFSWLYGKDTRSFDEMTNLPKDFRARLNETHCIKLLEPSRSDDSSDGTKKYLYPAAPGKFVEAAYIPDKERATLCVSTQVGCKMGCLFCMTARQGFQGQLTTGEILSQVYTLPERDKLTNLVYMGMGEPMDNIEAVLKSIAIFSDPEGLNMSQKRITVSTIGVIPAMRRYLEETRAQLAISIHNPFDAERRSMMPIQSVYPVSDLVQTLKEYTFKDRKLSFEYIMFDGINDTRKHAEELVRLANGLRVKVNLIHFHSIPDSPLRGSSRAKMEEFQRILKSKSVMTTIRKSRGEDIQAACGLLSTLELVKKPAMEDSDF